MGLNISKRVETTLSTTPAFTSACAAAYAQSLAQSQHAFPGLLPYQLLPASRHLHSLLTRPPTLPLLSRWAPPPPTQSQVDSTLRRRAFAAASASPPPESGEETAAAMGMFLDEEEFERFAVELFRGLIVGEVLKRVVVPAVGVGGLGGVVGLGSGGRVVIGFYALSVAASVYVSLSS